MKQQPTVPQTPAPDGRYYFSYAQIAKAVSNCVPEVKEFAPDIILAIGGGGLFVIIIIIIIFVELCS